jgi:integrase
MTVYLPKNAKSWYYDYRWRGQRFWGPTHQLTKADAQLVEAQKKLRQRQEAGGIAPSDVDATPRFQKWANVYLKYQQKFVDRPDLVKRAVDVVLEFWGERPRAPRFRPKGTNAHPQPAPYHDLRLGHPIADASWIERFERWIEARGVSGSTRNTYLSTLSGFYRVARDPQYRQVAQVPNNPFLEIRRSRRVGRVVALSVDQVKAWMAAAPRHVRIAMAIAALAPKLRLQTILELEWQRHFNRDLTRITVYDHKTGGAGVPQVTPIDPQLRGILEAVRGTVKTGFVVTYRGRPVTSIKNATKRAAKDAELPWGVHHGVTFHSIRHSVGTLLAELGIGERLRMEVMGHKEIRTTQQYTHLAAASQVYPHEQLSAALALKDIITAPAPPRRRRAGRTFGTADQDATEPARKRANRSARRSSPRASRS